MELREDQSAASIAVKQDKTDQNDLNLQSQLPNIVETNQKMVEAIQDSLSTW